MEHPKRTLEDSASPHNSKRQKTENPSSDNGTSLTDRLIAQVESSRKDTEKSCKHLVAFNHALYPVDESAVGQLSRLDEYDACSLDEESDEYPFTDQYQTYMNSGRGHLCDEIVLDDTHVCPSSFPLPTLRVLDRMQHLLGTVVDGMHNEYTKTEALHANSLPLETPLLPPSRLVHKLSPFQIHAAAALRMKHNVLVTAHTGAGKTLLAHVLISLYLAMGKRVVYTTPIKALSNDKFNELSQCYSSVGQVTGDSSINPDAQVLIVTTEVLRNEALRSAGEIAYSAVIFDEVHYMKDRERGVVWEESILSIGHRAQMLFLSATLRNDSDFAAWISSCTLRPCHVVGTTHRPVPLAHMIVPINGEGVHFVADSNKTFNVEAFDRARATIKKKATSKFSRPNVKNTISRTILNCVQNNLLPMIIFAFNRKELEMYAHDCVASVTDNNATIRTDATDRRVVQSSGFRRGHVDLTSDEEKRLITEFFVNFPPDVDCTVLKGMLLRGVGIHHSGLLPRVRECVEQLLRLNLVKLLFATETFAMGVNVPVRCVAFTTATKFDGSGTRPLTSAEYTQMAGRAGRRGFDRLGVCMFLDDGLVSMDDYREMVCGSGEEIEGRLALSYNLVLNLQNKSEQIEQIVDGSLGMFQYRKYVESGSLNMSLDGISSGTLIEAQKNVLECLYENTGLLNYIPPTVAQMQPYLVPGRVLYIGSPVGITSSNMDFGWSVQVNVRKTHIQKYELIVLTCVNRAHINRTPQDLSRLYSIGPQSSQTGNILKLADAASEPELAAGYKSPRFALDVISVRPELIKYVSSVRIPLPNEVITEEEKISVWCNLTKAHHAHLQSMVSGNLDFPVIPIHSIDPLSGEALLLQPRPAINSFVQQCLARMEMLQSAVKELDTNSARTVSNEELQRVLDRELQKKTLSTAYRQKTQSLAQNTQNAANTPKTEQVKRRGSHFIVDSHSDDVKAQFQKVHNELLDTLIKARFVDKDTLQVLRPGSLALYFDSVDCIVLSNLLLELNVNGTKPSHFAALMTVFFPREKLSTDDEVQDVALLPLYEVLEKVTEQLFIDAEYTSPHQFKHGMMQAVMRYAETGENELGSICAECGIFPGSFARVLSRVVNLLVQIEEAAAHIGATELTDLATNARKMIHKGSVFLSSLYIMTDEKQ